MEAHCKVETLQDIIRGSTGTLGYHKLSFMPLLATDGVAEVAEKAGAHWLVDIVASYQGKHRGKKFQVWTLRVDADGSARVEAREDTGRKPFVVQKIDSTDFPVGTWKFYVTAGWVGDEASGHPAQIMMLPGEY